MHVEVRMAKYSIRYKEGQWFAAPLRTSRFALGIVVRGSYRNGICLEYFFGPVYSEVPDMGITLVKKPNDAILITRFGDRGITTGEWPLIESLRLFSREE
jgi:hypothetical protein